MKFMMILALLLAGNAVAADSKSLDEMLGAQQVQVISPVKYNGVSVISYGGPGVICRALGFSRLVSSDLRLEQFNKGDSIAEVPVNMGESPTFEVRKMEYSGDREVVHSLTCAK